MKQPFEAPLSAIERIALRFLACYLALYAPVVLSSLGFLGLPLYWYDRLWQAPVRGAAALFGVTVPQVVPPAPSSDSFQIAQAALFLALAGVGAVIWSAVASLANRPKERTLYQWIRIGARYLLAYGMFYFGIGALLRFQFPALTAESLVTPVGEMRAWEMLWAFVGWSALYTTFLALVEIAGGVLLLRRETTLLGALIAGAVLSNVVLLNVLFEVPGISLSPHFALLTGLLVLPDARRLFDLHVMGASVAPADLARDVPGPTGLGRHRSVVKLAAVALIALSPLIVVKQTRGYVIPPSPQPLAGLYEVKTFARASDTLSPVVGDSVRWRRVAWSSDGTRFHVERMNGTWIAYVATIDTTARRIGFAGGRPSDWRAGSAPSLMVRQSGGVRSSVRSSSADTVIYRMTKNGKLDLAGSLDGAPIAVALERVDPTRFRLLSDARP